MEIVITLGAVATLALVLCAPLFAKKPDPSHTDTFALDWDRVQLEIDQADAAGEELLNIEHLPGLSCCLCQPVAEFFRVPGHGKYIAVVGSRVHRRFDGKPLDVNGICHELVHPGMRQARLDKELVGSIKVSHGQCLITPSGHFKYVKAGSSCLGEQCP